MYPRNIEEIEIFRNDRVNSSIGKFIAESYEQTKENIPTKELDKPNSL